MAEREFDLTAILIMNRLQERHDAAVAFWRDSHPLHSTHWEVVGEQVMDWEEGVAPHEEALALGPAIVEHLRGFSHERLERAPLETVDLLIDSALVAVKTQSAGPGILIQGVLQPYRDTPEGKLVRALAIPWRSILDLLLNDWNVAYQLPYERWEELVAGAFDRAGYDQVTLTPRSGDYGRDVIAVKYGVGTVRIVGSVKALRPDRVVGHDDVRALAGVLLGDPQATKGMVMTTSEFAPGVRTDPFLSPLMPYRLELMNGPRLSDWLATLAGTGADGGP